MKVYRRTLLTYTKGTPKERKRCDEPVVQLADKTQLVKGRRAHVRTTTKHKGFGKLAVAFHIAEKLCFRWKRIRIDSKSGSLLRQHVFQGMKSSERWLFTCTIVL